jgi:hypothetical protein
MKRRSREWLDQRRYSLKKLEKTSRLAALDVGPEPLGTRISHRFTGLGLIESLPELHGQRGRAAEF